jgi:UDP-glucose 4-epimerase
MKKSKLLVTGASGFIGKNLLLHLSSTYEVHGTYLAEEPILFKDRATWHPLDISDSSAVHDLVGRVSPEYIVHLASSMKKGNSEEEISESLRINLGGARSVFDAALGLKSIRAIVAMGSAEEYGDNPPPFAEAMKERPVSAYSLSKAAATILSSYYSRIHRLPIIVLRPFVVYGPMQEEKQLIPYVISRCLKNEPVELTLGEQTRDFIYVDDLADAISLALQRPERCSGEIMNICSGKEVRVREAVELIKEEAGSSSQLLFGKIPYRKGEIMRYCGSAARAGELLSWKPKTGLRQGIRKTVKWFSGESR